MSVFSEGTSQFGFLELSQSQDLRGEEVNSQEEDLSERCTKSGTKTFISILCVFFSISLISIEVIDIRWTDLHICAAALEKVRREKLCK